MAVRLAAAAVLLLVFLWAGLSIWARLDPSREIALPTEENYNPFMDDYVVYWTAGRMVLDGNAGRLYDLDAVQSYQARATGQPSYDVALLPYFNPPFAAGALAVLAVLPLGVSAVVFTGVSLAALGAGLRFLLSRLETRLEVVAWTLGVLSSMPIYYTLLHGQLSFLLFFLFVAVYILLKRGSDGLAGATLALLLLKPPLVLLPLLVLALNRRMEALRGFLTCATGLVVASLLVGGPSSLIAYPELLATATTWDDEAGILIWAMFGWNAFFEALTGPADFPIPMLLAGAASIGTLVLCLRAWKGPWNAQSPDFDVRYSILVLGVLLTSPHLYGQDLIIGVIPAALLYGAFRSNRDRLVIVALVLAIWAIMRVHVHLLDATGLNFVTLLIFAIFLVARARLPDATLGAQDKMRAGLPTSGCPSLPERAAAR
jgi:hypothetical protein